MCQEMERTQIYLTNEQRRELKKLVARSGKSQSELIREAIDALVAGTQEKSWKSGMMAAAGLWADRDDLPDFAGLRAELDRLNRPEA
jgi:Arc/MetJ-type ribon-helix-helix transcriptional regulator